MKRKSFRSLISYLIAISFSLGSSAPAFAEGATCPGGKAKEIVAKCEDIYGQGVEAGKFLSAAAGANAGPGVQGATTAGSKANAGTKAVIFDVAKECEKIYQECSSIKCDDDAATKTEQQTCKDDMNKIGERLSAETEQVDQTQAGTDATQTASSGSGSGLGGSMMPMLLGAALGAGAMYLLGGDDDKDKKKKKKDDPTNGVTDCTAEDAYKFTECNDELVAYCMTNITTARCTSFTARFCSAPVTSTTDPTTTTTTTTTSSTTDLSTTSTDGALEIVQTAGPNGEGLGTSFCKTYIASNFCKAADKATCPSCLNKAMQESPICKTNPSMCIAQNSPEQIAQAKLMCPTDPLFADPNFTSGAAVAGLVNSSTPIPITDGAVPTLNTNSATTGTDYNNGGSTVTTSSYSAASAGQQGLAYAAGSSGANSSAGAKDAASGNTGSNFGGAGSNYSTASASSGQMNRVPSASGGASDVASGSGAAMAQAGVMSQYGPSLFAASSQVYQIRCAQNQIVNCAP